LTVTSLSGMAAIQNTLVPKPFPLSNGLTTGL
jgi:hypothetical protein